MTYKLRIAVTAAAVALLVSFAAAQVPQFSPFSADMHMSSTAGAIAGPDPREMDGRIYVGRGHMRLDMSPQGHETAVITDFATKTVEILMIEPKMYMEHKAGAMSRGGPADPAEDLKPFDPDNPCANQPDITCKRVGMEEISGRNCEHWEITDKNGKVLNVWVDPKLHFPVKTVGKDGTILLTNIKEGEQDASLFTIPPDFHKMDLGTMMQRGAGGPPQN